MRFVAYILLGLIAINSLSNGALLKGIKHSMTGMSPGSQGKISRSNYNRSISQSLNISLRDTTVSQQLLITGLVLGTLITLVAYLWIVSIATLDSMAWGLTCLLFPPSILVYTLSGISAKAFRPLLIFGCGFIIASSCGALFVLTVS